MLVLTALATWPEPEILGLVLLDVFLGARDDRRFGVVLLQEHLVAQHGEVLGEDGQQLDHRLMPLGRHHRGGEIGLLELGRVHIDAPFLYQLERAPELGFGGPLPKHLARLQKADQPVPQPHRHRRIAQARRAADGVRFLARHFGKLLLDLEAGGTGAAGFRHDGAEGAFVALAMMRKLPRFHRAQGDRQACGLGERLFVVVENLGIAQGLNQAAVAADRAVIAGLAGRWRRRSAICPRRACHAEALSQP